MKISEIFASIQGEGKLIGRAQVFVRLYGSNMGCAWCDTRYAKEGGNYREMDIGEIFSEIKKHNLKSVCITGGEPMVQKEDLKKLINILKENNYEILLETNGSIYDEGIFKNADCVCVDMKSPTSKEKSDESMIFKLGSKDIIKIIIADERDYEFAKHIISLVSEANLKFKTGDRSKKGIEVFLQPEQSTIHALNPDGWINDVVKSNFAGNLGVDVRVVPQVHKILGLK